MVVTVSGTIDALTSPALYGAAAVAVQKKPEGLIFDFTDVTLLASAGMQVLITTMRMLGPSVGYAVVADGPATSRPLEIAGVADFIDVYPTLDAAMARVSKQTD